MSLNNAAANNVSYPSAQSSQNSSAQKQGGYSFYTKLLVLYLLNIIDWVCTEALISSGQFYEANPIMQPVFQSFWLTLAVKGVLPLLLIGFCCFIYKLAGIKESTTANVIIYIGLIAYSLVNMWHIINFLLLFFAF